MGTAPLCLANHVRTPGCPSNPPFRWQLSYLVVPPYWYVATTYLLCFSLLRKHRGCGGILSVLELMPFLDHSGPRSFFSCTYAGTYPLSFHILAHSFGLFCTSQERNPLVFKRFLTLCQKKAPTSSALLFRIGRGGLIIVPSRRAQLCPRPRYPVPAPSTRTTPVAFIAAFASTPVPPVACGTSKPIRLAAASTR